jgi:hypothetical protein
MRVLLKLRLDCRPDAAWRALQSPTVMRECAGPWLDYASLEPAGFPPRWNVGAHPVTLLAAGFAPIGGQTIQISLDTTRHEGVRIVHDDGGALNGVPNLITRWDHRMAVSPHPDDPSATLYRDRLVFEAGAATIAMWPSLWALWQWRGLRLRQLAPGFDELPPADPES